MKKNLRLVSLCAFALLIFLSNSSNPPNRRTGAPGDSGTCASCHDGNNSEGFDGSVSISGIPEIIQENTTYAVTVTVSNPNLLASRAGFQWVSLFGDNNQNAGTISNPDGDSDITSSSGRTYHEHRPALSFNGNTSVSWSANWTSPAASSEDELIRFYSSAVIGDGSGDARDLVVTNVQQTVLQKTEAEPLELNLLSTENISCFGNRDGQANIEVNGGVPPYNFIWSNGEQTSNASELEVGINSVTVTDSEGSSETLNVIIQAPEEIIVDVVNITNIDCENEFGTANIVVSGGTPPLSYTWSSGEQSPTAVNLEKGDQFVTVSDNNGCEVVQSLIIPEETAPEIQSVTVTNPSCYDSQDGSISVSTQFGEGPFQYNWSNGITEETLIGINAGQYALTITDVNNCVLIENFTVEAPELLQSNLIKTDQTTFGQNDGSASVTPSGGVPPYSVQWSNGETGFSTANLAPGIYDVTVTDSNSCADENTFVINSIDCDLVLNFNTSMPNCVEDFTGAIDIEVQNGTEPFSYNWSNGLSSQNLENLSSGIFELTVTDALGCNLTQTFTLDILDTIPPEVICPEKIEFSFCETFEYPTIIASDNCDELNIELIEGFGSEAEFPVGISTEMYRISDNNGNETVCSFDIEIFQEISIEIESSLPSSIDSQDGEVKTIVQGGSGQYNYEWFLDGELISTEEILTDASSASYVLIVTDSRNCSQTIEIDLNLTVSSTANSTLTEEVSIYPNPSNRIFTLDLGANINNNTQIEIFDSNGKLVQKVLDNTIGRITVLDMSNNNPGIYYLRISDLETHTTQKLVLLD